MRSAIERRNRARGIARLASLALADRAGVTTLEFALVGSLFFILIFGVVEIGRGLWTMNALNYAVQQGARCASVNSTDCGTQSGVRSFAIAVSGALVQNTVFSLNPSPVPSWAPTCSTTDNNLVTASYSMPLYVPFVSMQPTLTAASCFPK